jgi:hypothetical protein
MSITAATPHDRDAEPRSHSGSVHPDEQLSGGVRHPRGVVVNIVTKSGTNQFHGTGWNYMRNEALNARPWADAFFGRPNPRYRYNYFGGNLGGPIRKDRLFLFFNYENLKQDSPTQRQQIPCPPNWKGTATSPKR